MKKLLMLMAAGLVMLPLIYLFFIWPQVPQTVPMHFGINGHADRYGSKAELRIMMILLSALNAGVYLLLCNAYRIDPKRRSVENKERMQKIAFAVLIFLSAIQLWILYITQKNAADLSPKFILIAVGLLFCVLGNYMYNIKPNYFAGIRLPWTLESEDNWRKTHHLASKLWVAIGLLSAVCSFFLPFNIAIGVFFSLIFISVLIPGMYSYQLFKKSKL